MKKINVILVEDDDVFRDCLAEMLELSDISVGGVNCAMDFYQAINTNQYDVAIIDIGLPDRSGLRLVEFLRENSNVGIILLSGLSAIENRVEGYNCGADHFFVKPVDSIELIAAINSLYARLSESPAVPEDKIGHWSLDKTSWKLASPDGHEVKMTAKEMIFMDALMSCAGKNITRQALSDTLNYPADDYGNRSMDAMVRRLRKKSAQELDEHLPVQTVHAVGYCFSSPAIVLGHNQ